MLTSAIRDISLPITFALIDQFSATTFFDDLASYCIGQCNLNYAWNSQASL